MGFFDDFSKKASEALKATADKTSEMGKELQLKGKINELTAKQGRKFKEIGEAVFNAVVEGKDPITDDVKVLIDEVTAFKEDIKRLEGDILKVKGIKHCVNCGEELSLDVGFCPKCGTEQPKEEVAKEAEVVEEEPKEENNEESEPKE